MSLTIRLQSIKYLRDGYDEVVIEEPYVLVTAVSLQRPILPNFFLPNLQVFPYRVWDDLDGDEEGFTSGASFWDTELQPRDIANPDEVIFVVTLMQNDHGNPDRYRSLVLSAAGASMLSTLGVASRTVKVKRLLDDIRRAIDSACGPRLFDDNHIGTEELRLEASDLIPLGTREKLLTIFGDEGQYELSFRIHRVASIPLGEACG